MTSAHLSHSTIPLLRVLEKWILGSRVLESMKAKKTLILEVKESTVFEVGWGFYA